MNNLNSLKSAELIEIATNAAPAEKAVAKGEIKRRPRESHGQREESDPCGSEIPWNCGSEAEGFR